MNTILRYLTILSAAGLMYACGGAPTAEQAADKHAKPGDVCNLTLEPRHTTEAEADGRKVRVVSVLVNNFTPGEACWTQLQAEAQKTAVDPNVATRVFFFDCPGHTPELDAANPKVEGEYAEHCVATWEPGAQGKPAFVKTPFM